MSVALQRALLWAALLLPAGAALAAGGLDTATTPFDARFDVAKAGLPLGTTHFVLAPAKGKPGCFIYRGQANPNALVRMFLGDIDERSRFCIVDGHVRPQQFSHRVAGKPKKSYTLTFDWTNGQIHYADRVGREKQFAIEPGVQDPLSLQIAARAWVATALSDGTPPATLGERHFRLADDDGIEDFSLAVDTGGKVTTPAGPFDTVRIARTGKHSHTLVLWLATARQLIPVQVETGQDGTTFTMKATALSAGESARR